MIGWAPSRWISRERFPAVSRRVLTSLGAFSLFTMGGKNANRRTRAQDEKPGRKEPIVATDDGHPT
jgi:hypothetical protein